MLICMILRSILFINNNFFIRQRASDTTITPSNSMVTPGDYDIVSQSTGFLIYNPGDYYLSRKDRSHNRKVVLSAVELLQFKPGESLSRWSPKQTGNV